MRRLRETPDGTSRRVHRARSRSGHAHRHRDGVLLPAGERRQQLGPARRTAPGRARPRGAGGGTWPGTEVRRGSRRAPDPVRRASRYRTFPLGVPDVRAERAVVDFEPDLVHLASPIALGMAGLRAAERLHRPVVAVYQTDIVAFARQYGLRLDPLAARWVARLHRRATRTLVPSTSSRAQLEALRVRDLHLWRRGISLELFAPRLSRRAAARGLDRWRSRPDGHRLRRAARGREAGAPAA